MAREFGLVTPLDLSPFFKDRGERLKLPKNDPSFENGDEDFAADLALPPPTSGDDVELN